MCKYLICCASLGRIATTVHQSPTVHLLAIGDVLSITLSFFVNRRAKCLLELSTFSIFPFASYIHYTSFFFFSFSSIPYLFTHCQDAVWLAAHQHCNWKRKSKQADVRLWGRWGRMLSRVGHRVDCQLTEHEKHRCAQRAQYDQQQKQWQSACTTIAITITTAATGGTSAR